MTPKVMILLGILLAAYVSASATEEGPRYGYAGSIGPSNWASLSPEYKQCSDGKLQSPVNIAPDDAASKPSKMGSLERRYSPFVNHTILINTGSHIELKLQPNDGYASLNHAYYLDYIRFHTPAEHTIEDKVYPLEVQIIHRDQDGKELIVSILYKLGSPDTFLYKLKQHLKELASDNCGDDEEAHILIKENLKTKTLKKAGGRYYGYVGSQTVPPCEEGVLWFISKKVRTVSIDQIKALQAPLSAEYQSNSRPVFPRDAGNITKYND